MESLARLAPDGLFEGAALHGVVPVGNHAAAGKASLCGEEES